MLAKRHALSDSHASDISAHRCVGQAMSDIRCAKCPTGVCSGDCGSRLGSDRHRENACRTPEGWPERGRDRPPDEEERLQQGGSPHLPALGVPRRGSAGCTPNTGPDPRARPREDPHRPADSPSTATSRRGSRSDSDGCASPDSDRRRVTSDRRRATATRSLQFATLSVASNSAMSFESMSTYLYPSPWRVAYWPQAL
jgi:hypothetical protein